MAIHRILPTVRETLNAEGNNPMVGCLTPWRPVTGVDTLRASWAVRALTGGISVQPVVQLATVRTDRPGDFNTVGATPLTANDDRTVEYNISGDSDDFFYFRMGLQYAANVTPGHADCRLTLSYSDRGQVVARRTLDLDPQGTGTSFVPITGPLPAVAVDKVKAAFLFTGGALARYTLAIRTFDSDTKEGGPWSLVGSLYDPTSDDYDEHLLPDTSVLSTLTGKMYYQLGIACDNGGAGAAYGRLTVLAAVRGA